MENRTSQRGWRQRHGSLFGPGNSASGRSEVELELKRPEPRAQSLEEGNEQGPFAATGSFDVSFISNFQLPCILPRLQIRKQYVET